MFSVGEVVRFRSGYCSKREEKLTFIVKEVLEGPASGEAKKYKIENPASALSWNSTEVVNEYMLEKA